MYKFLGLAAVLTLSQGITKGCAGDSDYDSVTDDVDNCLELYNPMQADEDADGIGDACDTNTPYHKAQVGGCYLSDWPPLRGVNWEDRPTLIEQGDVDPTALSVAIDWTASDSDWIERGRGTTTGTGVWFDIADEHNPYLFTRTVVEGIASDVDADGRIDEIVGTYIMYTCESEDPTYCEFYDGYELWNNGDWIATRVNSLECERL